MAHLGLQVKDKLAKAIVDGLTPLLEDGENITAIFWAVRMKPLTDAIVTTSHRLLAVQSSHIASGKGFFGEIAGDDIKSASIKNAMLSSKLVITKPDGIEDVIATIQKDDADIILQFVNKISGSPKPLAVSEEHTQDEVQVAPIEKVLTADNKFKNLIVGKVNKASLKEVMRSCRNGELPVFIAGEWGGGVLAAFDDRCMIIKKGLGTSFMASSFGGGRTVTIPYGDITGIEYNAGIVTGTLEILTPSYPGTKNTTVWAKGGSEKNAFELPNVLPWSRSTYNEVRSKIDWLQERVREIKSGSVSASVSAADELTKLADLHRQGFLSDREFAAAKAKLLGRA